MSTSLPVLEPRPNPYVGPRAFQTGETLYGRDHEVNQLLDLLIAERIILLHSPSGAGKSSLVQAGLIPRLEQEGFHVLPPMRVNLEPPPGLRDIPAFNRYIYSAQVSLREAIVEEQRPTVDGLQEMTLQQLLESNFLLPEPDGLAENGAHSKVLIFDQFEEILTVDPTRRHEKMVFFAQLGSVLRNRNRWALFSMREDYLAALDPYLRPVPTRFKNTFRLDFLGEEAACQAIQQPARQAGVDFTDEAVQKLIDDLRRVQVQRPDGSMEEQLGPYIEPVQLQVVCYRLWDHLPQDASQILTSDIETVGDVDAALADYYSERVTATASQTGAGERLIRDWFERRLITPQGIRGQVLMGQNSSEGLQNGVIQQLENAHLVRAEKRGGAIWFELAHDRLIGPVRGSNAAWFQANLSLFQRQAVLWEAGKRPDSLLLRDKDLDEALAWAKAHPQELTETEHSYLEACQELRKREEEARKLVEAQQVAETERQRAEMQARSARQLRRLARIIAVALLVAVITTILAGVFWQRSEVTARNNAQLADTNGTIAAVNAVYASTNQAAASTAQNASTQAVSQQKIAESASTQENFQRKTAEAASKLANDQKVTAQYNADEASKNAKEAKKQSSIAFSRQLASQALSYLSSQPDLAMLLGVQSYGITHTLESESALLTGLQRGLSQTTKPYGPPIPSENTAITSVAMSSDGEHMAWGDAEGNITLWNYSSGKIEKTWKDHQGIVWSIAFSSDGKKIASAGDDSNITFRDIASEENDKTSMPQGNKVASVAWSPDGQKLAAAVGPHVVIYNLANPKQAPLDQNILVDVNSVAWSPDGSKVAAATSFPNVVIIDPQSGEINQKITGYQDKVKSVAWSADSKTLASGGVDRLVYLYDMVNNKPLGEPLKGHTDEVLSVSISHDNSILASGSKDGTIILWDVRTGRQFGEPLKIHSSEVNGVAFLPSNGPTLLGSSSRDKSAQLVEVVAQQSLRKALPSVIGQVLALGMDGNGSLLAGVVRAFDAGVRDVQGNKELEHFTATQAITSAALSRDGKTFALGTEGGKINLYETASGNAISSFNTPGGKVLSLAFSPDGQTLASSRCADSSQAGEQTTCNQNEILLWNVADGTAVGQPIPGHEDLILALAFSSDGKLLASGSQDRSIRFWDVNNREQVGLPLKRHSDSVTSLSFSPDGRILASGSDDNTLILWDVVTEQPIGEPLIGSPGSALSLSFSPDSKLLYSGYKDGSLLSWDTDFQAWLKGACDLAGRNLTTDEWEQFFRFQDLPYQKTCDQFPDGSQVATATPTPTSTPTP